MRKRATEEPMMPGSVPVPDPTVLTTKLTEREIAALRELQDQKIQAVADRIEARLDGMDKALVLVQGTHQRLADLVLALEGKLTVRMDEKISAYADVVEVRFAERDTRFEAEKRDSKTAVDAALQAAKEAVGKSETNTMKQIDQQGVLIHTTTKATDEKIDDIKERLTRIEGRDLGATASQTRTTQSNQWGIGAILSAIAILISMAGIFIVLLRAS